MRILHLVTAFSRPSSDMAGSPADCAAVAARAASVLLSEHTHAFLTIGGSDVERRLACLGIRTQDRISAAGFPHSPRRALAAYLRDRPPFDRILAWHAPLREYISPGAPPSPDVPLPVISDVLRASPAVLPLPETGGAALTELAGATGEPLPLVLFGADPPDAGDAASMFRIIGIADKSGARFVMVLPRGVQGAARATRVHRDARIGCPLIISECSPVQWLPQADIVLTAAVKDPREACFRSLAEAWGVPVVTSPTAPGAETMRDYFGPAATNILSLLAAPRPSRPQVSPADIDQARSGLMIHCGIPLREEALS